MSEKRKPKITMLLKWEAKEGQGIKTHKIELYDASVFNNVYSLQFRKQFRMRVDGKWWPEGERKYFYKTQIRDILWASIPFY